MKKVTYFLTLVAATLLATQVSAQMVKKISKEEEKKIRDILGKDAVGQKALGSEKQNKGPDFFKDGSFEKDQYNKQFTIKRDSTTIEEVRLSRTSQIEIMTCYDNEIIFTVHPDYYEDITISMEKLSRPDNFEFDPILDRSGKMKGGAIRTKAFSLQPGQRVEGQLAIQIDESKEWYNVILHAEACPAGKLDYLRVVYFKPDRKDITSKTNLLTPQDKFIELTHPFTETNPKKDFDTKVGDIIASPNSDWLILSLYVFLKKPIGDHSLSDMIKQCETSGNEERCQSLKAMDQKLRTFKASFAALHANRINEIDLVVKPLQIQTEAISKSKGAQVARYNLKINVNHRYTQEYEHFYLFVKDTKREKYQVLKLNIEEFVEDFKKRGGRF